MLQMFWLQNIFAPHDQLFSKLESSKADHFLPFFLFFFPPPCCDTSAGPPASTNTALSSLALLPAFTGEVGSLSVFADAHFLAHHSFSACASAFESADSFLMS